MSVEPLLIVLAPVRSCGDLKKYSVNSFQKDKLHASVLNMFSLHKCAKCILFREACKNAVYYSCKPVKMVQKLTVERWTLHSPNECHTGDRVEATIFEMLAGDNKDLTTCFLR